ncbi:MAG: LptA/OstA family protein [Paracoccaceae bacterium]|tara:strand:+ start:971 stop:1447 length:477 start_codon:yes stop_codon:yes gene_type:complete
MFLYRSCFLKFFNYFYISFIVIFYLITTTQILLGEVSDREVLISSENAKFDQKLGVISLNENVVLKLDNLTFTSDKMELFFEDNSNFTESFSNLKKIIASGNVFFERDQDIIKSDLVYFFPKENTVKITGNVKVVKGKNIGFRSEILEINLNKDKFLN